MKPTMPKYCRREREDKLLVVTLDRPDVLNSLNAPACFELEEIFNDFERRSQSVDRGHYGRRRSCFFAAGHDLADAPTRRCRRAGGQALLSARENQAPDRRGERTGDGRGFEIALACDIRHRRFPVEVCDERTALRAVALGGGAQRLATRLPPAIAMGMLLSGRRFDAVEAHRWGLVTEIAAPGQVMEVARRWADES